MPTAVPSASIWPFLTMPRLAQRRRWCRSIWHRPTQRRVGPARIGGPAFYAYSTNDLIDLDHAVIMDVEASTAVRQAEVTACKRMIARVQDRLGVWPERLAADTAYGSAEMLAWLVHERGIQPHIPVFDKSARRDGTFERIYLRP
jgi:hypothetical protein